LFRKDSQKRRIYKASVKYLIIFSTARRQTGQNSGAALVLILQSSHARQ
jgi:hypothetical protein